MLLILLIVLVILCLCLATLLVSKSSHTKQTKFVLWKGDITTLTCDAIVNAANESGLGCTIPGHCIDSAIHAAAGPALRAFCKTLHGIPTGTAKITPAYKLPCKWIIHTTGPKNVNQNTSLDWDTFRQCYERCLELGARKKLTTIAFCCLSTGIFEFPKKKAAQEALVTVAQWLSKNEHSYQTIIFNVFTFEDYEIYSNAGLEP